MKRLTRYNTSTVTVERLSAIRENYSKRFKAAWKANHVTDYKFETYGYVGNGLPEPKTVHITYHSGE